MGQCSWFFDIKVQQFFTPLMVGYVCSVMIGRGEGPLANKVLPNGWEPNPREFTFLRTLDLDRLLGEFLYRQNSSAGLSLCGQSVSVA
jgi:hypothetical protein